MKDYSILKPNLDTLKPSQIDNINDMIKAVYILVSQTNGVNYLKTHGIRYIDDRYRYPVSTEIISECKKYDIVLPSDNRIYKSQHTSINKKLKSRGSTRIVMIEHIGDGIKELLKSLSETSTEEEFKKMLFDHSHCFYRFKNGVNINGSTPFTLDEALNEVKL